FKIKHLQNLRDSPEGVTLSKQAANLTLILTFVNTFLEKLFEDLKT
ncbi:MAG: hypothetical protein ACI81F_000629, partial [Thalassolituus oleivorans]